MAIFISLHNGYHLDLNSFSQVDSKRNKYVKDKDHKFKTLR